MGVEKLASCKFPKPLDMAMILSDCSAVVNGVEPPISNCESSPRYWSGPEDVKAKAFHSEVSFKESSGDVRLLVKAAEEDAERGRAVGSERSPLVSEVGYSVKSQLIDRLP
jgi:hypothetical protein